MRAVNIHEAKTKLSRLVNQAAQGEPFIIAKAGKPLVKVVPLDAPQAIQRLGFMEGEILVPEDFGQMGSAEIEQLFQIRPYSTLSIHDDAGAIWPVFRRAGQRPDARIGILSDDTMGYKRAIACQSGRNSG